MILPVIILGGTGSRLWPLSREFYPKQFLSIQGTDSMLQATVKRLSGLDHQPPLFICNEEHRFLVLDQLNHINQSFTDIILEPVGHNTAPAITLAALRSLQTGADPLLLVLAADHVIADVAAFQEAVCRGIPFAEQGKLVAFGVLPTYPESGYGYIKAQSSTNAAFEIDSFIEKPCLELAQSYIEAGNYFWNSGLFLFRASCYLEELKKFQPDIYTQCDKALSGKKKNLSFISIDKSAFDLCPADSIDYAVMEKTKLAVVVPMTCGWSDIGSWAAMWQNFEKDEQGNVKQGDVISLDTTTSFIRSDDKLVVTMGLKDTVVINTKDAVLVAAKECAQDVKKVVALLNGQERSEAKSHSEVFRPWGKYDSLAQGPRYQVKRITVKPGEKLSLQMHHHRAEHWVVVSGTAKVTKNAETYYLTENQSTYIPLGTVHSLENPGKVPLEIIEVQSGSYLGEDDIIRYEDRYGRAMANIE
ncbi:MAG: mannose-1-phosphate guanylyltransferase/mannose-6-phosphate isomerase [Legionella sp.]|nr:mannose-1-phosphate guanylyltransferase/mannose-6-phosphate isomerase [Legionella sp.]